MLHIARMAALLVLAAGLTGCGSKAAEEKAVATAGDLTVTLADFHLAYNKITPNYRPDISTLEGKRQFANDLVNREILLAEGRRMGGINDPKILAQLEANAKQSMLGVLYREEISSQVEVLGRDVAEVYEKRKFNVKASHILLDDVPTGERVREEIMSGKISFEDAAAKYSMNPANRDRGGSMGELTWSHILTTHQKAAFDLKVGEISPVLDTEVGVNIVRLDERIEQDLPPLEDLRITLRNDVRQQLETMKMKEYVANLARNANLKWNDDGVRVLQEVIARYATVDLDTVPPPLAYLPEPTPEESTITLATLSGRDYTIADYVDGLSKLPPANRPAVKIPFAGIKEYIRTSQFQPLLLEAKARELGIDKRAEVVDEAARLRERILVEMVHARFLQAADVPEEDVRAVYDSTLATNPEALLIPERVDMVLLVHADSSVVAEGLRRIRAGEDEATVIQEISMDPRTAPKGGRTGLIARGNYALDLEDAAFSGRVGEGWSDPVVTPSGTGAVKVLAHEQPRTATFEEMLDTLTRQLANQRGEAAFEEWLQAERASRGVEIHDEVLELIGQSVS